MASSRDIERSCDPRLAAPGVAAPVPSHGVGLRFVRLAAASHATERPHRRRGVGRWLRALEQRSSHLLARHVYPRVPGIHRPYDQVLREAITVSTAELAVPALAPAFDGLEILLISDVHAGPFVSRAALSAAFARIAKIPADLILLGGDLVTCRAEEFDDLAPALGSLVAPLGTFMVLGNHDHATGEPGSVLARAHAAGLECLHNRSVELERDGARLSLAGIDDLREGRPDLDRALRGTRSPVLLLSHHPDVAFDAARKGVALVLSGHTHGGQIVLPGFPLRMRQSRHGLDAGRYRAGPAEVVVSRGLGVVGLPLRVGSPAEVVHLTLRRHE